MGYASEIKNMTTASSTEEYLDLVDENDQVISQKKRSEVYAEGYQNFGFRVVNLFVVNSQGQIWLPRRRPEKVNCPLHLDASMGGHVSAGETYEQALKRETLEELNLDVDQVALKFLGYLTPQQHGVSAFMKVYETTMDEAPDYNPNDFFEYLWVRPQELFDRIAQGEKTKSDLPKMIKIFYKNA